MKFIIVFSFSLLFLVTFISCDANEPLPQGAVGLTLEDVSCTEAWMTLTAGNLSNTAYIRVTGNGKLLETLDVNSVKTTLYFDTLQPNTTYEFQAFSSQRGEEIVGNKLQFTTLDTTSHNFTWQTFTFGDNVGSSSLYDVAIISEDDIWAVGEIYMNDSLSNPDPICYNAVHWNGSVWELKKIPILLNGTPFYPVIKSIFAFNENDIWFEAGIHWDGISFKQIPFNIQWSGNVNKLWGSSSNDLYAVGNNGSLAHYQNGSWTKIESGTNDNIVGISGVQIDEGKYVKYCAADNLLLKIDGDNNLTSVAVEQGMFLNSVWAASNNMIYTAGDGIVLYKNNNWQKINTPDINTIYGINGQSFNDLVGLSANLSIFHFNGYSWNSIQTGINNIYLKIQIKNNIIATVGWQNDRAIITLLFRN